MHFYFRVLRSGACLSNPESGGTSRRWEVKIQDGDIFIGSLMPEAAKIPTISKENIDKIQLEVVSQALDRKYGPE